MSAPFIYNGPNFCPNCACNIRTVAIALAYVKQPAEEEKAVTEPKDAEPKPKAPPKKRAKISPELSAKIMALYQAVGTSATTKEMKEQYDLNPLTVQSHIHRKKQELKNKP